MKLMREAQARNLRLRSESREQLSQDYYLYLLENISIPEFLKAHHQTYSLKSTRACQLGHQEFAVSSVLTRRQTIRFSEPFGSFLRESRCSQLLVCNCSIRIEFCRLIANEVRIPLSNVKVHRRPSFVTQQAITAAQAR